MVKGKTIGEFVEHYRKNKGYSQRELAQMLGYSSGQMVSNIERGEDRSPVIFCGKLMKFLTTMEQNHLQELISDAVMTKTYKKISEGK